MINVAELAKNQNIDNVTIGFSTGKDSVVGLSLLKKANINVIPIYFYIVPGLEFIEKNIALYEKLFDVKVIQLPHPILYDYMRHQDWQSWQKTVDMSQIKLKKTTFKYLTSRYLETKNLNSTFIYDCNCMKAADSFNRRILLTKKPYICEENKIIYLTKDFTDKDIFSYLKENNIPLTDDYKIFGRSWDGLSYHFLTGVKYYYPNDYEKIKQMFDLIDIELFRYKIYKTHKK